MKLHRFAGLLVCVFFCQRAFGQTSVQPAGKEASLKVGGLIQVQAEFGDKGDSRYTTSDDRIYLRRGRLNVVGTFLEHFDFKLEVEGSGNIGNSPVISSNLRVQLTDVYINWNKDPRANIRGGQFKTFYGYERLMAGSRLYTIERSLVTDRLTFGRQIGAQANGDFLGKRFSYATGVFNGTGSNTSANDNDAFLTFGRVSEVVYQRKDGRETSWALGANFFRSDDKELSQPSDLGLPFATFTGTRYGEGVDSQFRFGKLEIWAEYLRQTLQPENSPTFKDFDTDGWYVQVSYFVLPQKIMLVGKYETFDPSTRTGDNETKTWIAGLNYYFKGDDLCLRFNYVHSDVPTLEGQNKLLIRMQVIF